MIGGLETMMRDFHFALIYGAGCAEGNLLDAPCSDDDHELWVSREFEDVIRWEFHHRKRGQ